VEPRAERLGARFNKIVETSDGRHSWRVGDLLSDASRDGPSLEWIVHNVTLLRQMRNVTFYYAQKEPWAMVVQLEAGSDQDSVIGVDTMPDNLLNYLDIGIPCAIVDECDVCLGDSLACRDCAFIPNGPNVYDDCDVCGGDGSTCRAPSLAPPTDSTVDVDSAPLTTVRSPTRIYAESVAAKNLSSLVLFNPIFMYILYYTFSLSKRSLLTR
jgi:hypothetical protein